MIRDFYKISFFSIEDIYFAQKMVNSKADIVRYFQYQGSLDLNKKVYLNKEFFTNIIDLSLSINEIRSSFRKSVKSEINQVAKNYNIKIDIHNNPSSVLIEAFTETYNKFAKLKNISLAKENKLLRLKEKGNIILSKAMYNNLDLVWHVYIHDQLRIRLLYSCSLQSKDEEISKLTVKVNKFLHFKEIEYARLEGFKVFDFGGISLKNKEVEGIDKFKLGFSKKIEKARNFVLPNTKKGDLILKLNSILKFRV